MSDGKQVYIVYESSIDQLTEINSSFDKGILRVAYAGKNRNKSFISKRTFEECIGTIYNCPIVCNYNRESDSIGGHDIEVAATSKGVKLINITQPVGVVPESAKYWWETITEDNGEEHEYLCVEVIIWKRQEAYSKIKENGITDESMEITVKSGQTIDGYYHIDSFEFTAFCLLESVEPCFESACVEMFSLNAFRNEYSKMMADFKKHFFTVNTSDEDDIKPHTLSKGGHISLDKTELLSEYGLTAESLDFNIDDFTIEELREKFKAMKKKTQDAQGESYSLTGEQFRTQLIESLSEKKCTDPYCGEVSKYLYYDYDASRSEVYCHDWEDWKLYGFSFSMNGDHVVIDFDSKKRKKVDIVDFDEGTSEPDYKYSFELFKKAVLASKESDYSRIKSELEEKYSQAAETINRLQSEVDNLQTYQKQKMAEERTAAEKALFARFPELTGVEAFESLRSDCSDMTLEALESKCFEIKGRSVTTENFSINKPKPTPSVKIAVEKGRLEDEPYGGLFIQHPPTN